MTDLNATGTIKLGLDFRRRCWHAAEVEHLDHGCRVLNLMKWAADEKAPATGDRPYPLALVVPDHLTITKRIRIAAGPGEPRDRAVFEMAQSLTAAESEYLFDVFPTGSDGQFLGVAARRDAVAAAVVDGLPQDGDPPPGIARAAALARGFLACCMSPGGDLIGIVDCGVEQVSICLLYRQHPVAFASLTIDCLGLSTDHERRDFAIELKTVINFQIASLFTDGITLPLSALVLAGIADTDPVVPIVKRYFEVPVGLPEVDPRRLADRDFGDCRPGDFLTAIGAAAN